jgi:hypothetical protein
MRPTPENAVDRTVTRVRPVTRLPSGEVTMMSSDESPDARVRTLSETRVVSSVSVTSTTPFSWPGNSSFSPCNRRKTLTG